MMTLNNLHRDWENW